jgi:hypothetical protein
MNLMPAARSKGMRGIFGRELLAAVGIAEIHLQTLRQTNGAKK